MKYVCIYLVYFLVFNSQLDVVFSNSSPNYLNIRPNYKSQPSVHWLDTLNIAKFKSVDIKDVNTELFFEFQDTRNGDILTTEEYAFWNGAEIYKDYITKINLKLY